MVEIIERERRSLEVTPTWSVATLTTFMVFICLFVERSIFRFGNVSRFASRALSEANAQAKNKVMRRQSTFALHRASHPWSQNQVLIWMLCFLRQFRSSVQKSDYMALRLGFITNHRLPQSYNFHKYMVHSMEDVGISCPLWGYAVLCVFVNMHGTKFDHISRSKAPVS